MEFYETHFNLGMLKAILIAILLNCILLFSCEAQSKQIIFDKYTTDNGLSNNECTSLLQDDDGFIWVATKDGLNQFDGKDFIKFYSLDLDNQLPSNEIRKIIDRHHHQLVIATSMGLAILDTKTGVSRKLIISSPHAMKKLTNDIQDMLIDSAGNLIVSTSAGIYVFNELLKLILRHDEPKSDVFNGNETIFASGKSLYLLPDGKIIVVTKRETMYELNIDRHAFLDFNWFEGNRNRYKLFSDWHDNGRFICWKQ